MHDARFMIGHPRHGDDGNLQFNLNACHAMTSTSKNVYLVIGGSGFLGRHIVNALLARGDSVSVFDIVQRYHDVPFYTGDITEQDSISDALRKVCASSPSFPS